MSLTALLITLGVVVTLLLLVTATAVILRRRERGGAGDALDAEPDDRPLAAVIANPVKIGDDTRKLIVDVCLGLGWAEPLWIETTVDDPGTGQARDAVDKGADVVLAAGGDGTVRAVAEALAGSGVAMGLLPAGTGNLLARTLGTPQEMGAATRVALIGDDRPIDVGRIRVDDDADEQAFLVMAGSGFDAAIMENTPEGLKERVGPLAYVISGLRAMRGRRTRVTLTFDGAEPVRRRSRTIVVGNSGTLLGGLVLMPAATIDDGFLDVVNLSPKGLAGWVAVAVRVVTRKRRGHSRVEHWQAREIEIVADEPQPAQIDGDPIGDVTHLRVRIEPGVLVMRVPGTADVRTVQVIGIGAGDPEYLTFQAAAAIARTDVFFTIDKGDAKADLAALRTALLARHARPGHRVVVAPDPERERDASAYEAAVVDWQDRRGALYAAMIDRELPDGGIGAFLVWGDPALYDGTLRILDGLDIEVTSIPGISSVQALAAAHRLILHRVGRPFTVTTGRRLQSDGMTGDDVVVMLDARCAFADLPPAGLDIYWGAYLGTPDELLVAGDLGAVAAEIRAVRAAARSRKGWIMDTYLLRRREP